MSKLTLAIAALAVAGTATSHAADMYEPQVIHTPTYEPAPVAVVETSGWYLRGDAAYVHTEMRGAHYVTYGTPGGTGSFETAKIKAGFSVGAGAGYQFTKHLRADVTADYYFKANFDGSTRGSCGVAAACVSTDSSSLSAFGLMANAYVDIGTYGRFTPYVGAGIGGTYVKWADLQNTSCQTGNPANCDPTVTHGGASNWRFTYALMAGAAVDITCQLKLDAGYRYRRVTGGKMFNYAVGGGPGFDKGFNIHEGRAGLRWQFGSNNCHPPAQPPVHIPPMEPPIYK